MDGNLEKVLIPKSDFKLFVTDPDGVQRRVKSIFPFRGEWVIQYSDASVDIPFQKDEPEQEEGKS